ncbi:hypothetical protein CYY_002151 [Polysphondylium violaceum]|uniref:Response regulatory domain-containing protein n=1 Tax=Polysphondylium violaceum TaxID=133409 RepID=A0A8J4Q0M9_9MYCE|nr:hypothetical protein CYY_002151 [Polysphondylium violaceum]
MKFSNNFVLEHRRVKSFDNNLISSQQHSLATSITVNSSSLSPSPPSSSTLCSTKIVTNGNSKEQYQNKTNIPTTTVNNNNNLINNNNNNKHSIKNEKQLDCSIPFTIMKDDDIKLTNILDQNDFLNQPQQHQQHQHINNNNFILKCPINNNNNLNQIDAVNIKNIFHDQKASQSPEPSSLNTFTPTSSFCTSSSSTPINHNIENTNNYSKGFILTPPPPSSSPLHTQITTSTSDDDHHHQKTTTTTTTTSTTSTPPSPLKSQQKNLNHQNLKSESPKQSPLIHFSSCINLKSFVSDCEPISNRGQSTNNNLTDSDNVFLKCNSLKRNLQISNTYNNSDSEITQSQPLEHSLDNFIPISKKSVHTNTSQIYNKTNINNINIQESMIDQSNNIKLSNNNNNKNNHLNNSNNNIILNSNNYSRNTNNITMYSITNDNNNSCNNQHIQGENIVHINNSKNSEINNNNNNSSNNNSNTIEKKKAMILVAEDDPLNRMIALNYLGRLGHTVTLAENGLQAYNLVKEKQFDLILMDVQMPIMDGLQSTSKIREYQESLGKDNNPRTPIIGLTTISRDECLSAGMDEHLCKPAKFQQLDRMISSFLNKSVYHSCPSSPSNHLFSTSTPDLLQYTNKPNRDKLISTIQEQVQILPDKASEAVLSPSTTTTTTTTNHSYQKISTPRILDKFSLIKIDDNSNDCKNSDHNNDNSNNSNNSNNNDIIINNSNNNNKTDKEDDNNDNNQSISHMRVNSDKLATPKVTNAFFSKLSLTESFNSLDVNINSSNNNYTNDDENDKQEIFVIKVSRSNSEPSFYSKKEYY